MLDKILASIALALLEYLSKRIESGKIALDSTMDIPKLRRAGSRIDEWVRQQNSTSTGGQSN